LITFDHDLGHLNPHLPLKFSTALWALYPSFQDVITTASEHCFFWFFCLGQSIICKAGDICAQPAAPLQEISIELIMPAYYGNLHIAWVVTCNH
jgi:hypothetical protein